MEYQCLRCNAPLLNNFQLIFDETGIELHLDKLLAEHFQLTIIKDSDCIQALCEKCVNTLVELYDISQLSNEQTPELANKLSDVKTEELILSDGEMEESHYIEEPFEEMYSDINNETEELVELNCQEEQVNFPQNVQESESVDAEITEDPNSIIDYDEESEDFCGFDIENQDLPDRVENIENDENNLEAISLQDYILTVIKSELEEVSYDQNTVCNICDEILTSHTSLLTHIETNHETESKSYPCIICDHLQIFDSIKHLAQHTVLKHYDLELITIYCMCPECGKRFSSFVEYNKHSCYKISVENRVLQDCDQCNKQFASNKRYRFHLQFHLENKRPKACFICDILFSHEDDFFEHIMYAHEKEDSLICKKCDRVFTTESQYNHHMSLHNAVRSYYCEYCPKSYFYKQMLMNHIEQHHIQEQSYECTICKKSLASKHILKRHMELKHSEKTEGEVNVCNKCGLVEASQDQIQSHIDKECPDGEITEEFLKVAYACEFCESAFKNVEDLKFHRQKHDKNLYQCWICSCAYSEYKKLKTHIIKHNTYEPIQDTFPINRHYVCDFESCEKSYFTWPSLRAHKVRHVSDAKFFCEICNQTFKAQNHLNIHMNSHGSNEELSCQFCPKICHSQMSLSVHVARKHNNNCITCPTCRSTYHSEKALNEHINAYHLQMKCEHCGKVTKNKRNLEIHIDMMHIKVKRYFCSTCNKGYYNNSDLKVHERAAHAETQKFKCSICGFATSYEASYNAHLFKHKNVKPFKCEECSREFTRKSCFKLHILRHSDNKPFVCPVEDCGRSFVMKGILNTHLTKAHSEVQTNSLNNSQKRENKMQKHSQRPAKRKKSNIKPPSNYSLTEESSENGFLEINDPESGIVLFDEKCTDDMVVLECTDEGGF